MGVSARIAQLQTMVASMAPPAVAPSRSSAPSAPSAPSASATSFAAALDTALAGSTTAKISGKLNSDGVPVELARFGNGKIPKSELGRVGSTGHRLWAPAADALEKMIAAAKADGVKIGITDSYRSFDEQVDLARRKGLYSQGGLAAKPGTSDHGWGLATDLDLNAKAQSWMRANGKRFGFEEDTPREPWHWKFTPRT